MTTRIDVLPGTISSPSAASLSRRPLRSVGAVLAGLVTIFATSTATDAVLHTTGVYPQAGVVMSHALFGLATAYRIVYGILGCYITARLAPSKPLAHSLVLGGVGFVLSVLGAIAMWDAGPAWYSLAIIAIAPPCAWLAGALRLRQLEASPRPAQR